MKTGSVTLSVWNTEEIKADVKLEFLVFIIVEAIRNILWQRRDGQLMGYNQALLELNPDLEIPNSEDVFETSINYLMDVIEENDPLFNSEDPDTFTETTNAITDKLNLLIAEIDTNNFPSVLEPYADLLFDVAGNNVYHSVSGTFVSNRVILCFNPTNNLFTPV